LLGPRE